ncbi:RagB/SusD family nutrient uptake outer membrane protein [Pedobacter sp. MC2016-24]|uniref:RagB/SusD family nutrient uptake outer membrane protein n=1 Tax=Pedobacter sp. MC2016-24 TaxID=2780090 RepID=UPI001882D7F6|nr:RagB/SusD family nutrient uptake outer membrane protein [Pedobacter sp. MC2016-24]MBE9603010.1 RagB/SusD family nutrient uptake outer membrane protein [Pedobacter sp. MC2016-24]
MKKKISIVYLWYGFFSLLLFQSCGKEWLDAKPDKSLLIPKSIEEYQALLDNFTVFNSTQVSSLAEIGSGDFFLSTASFQSLFSVQEKSAYIWAPTATFYVGELSGDWAAGYKRILNANLILYGVAQIKPSAAQEQSWREVKGSALFFRAFNFFNLAQEYCVAYVPASASTDLGLCLRLDYDVNIASKRSNLQETYDRILSDLEEAGQLMNANAQFKSRPSKEAVYALMARVYLAMENYERAGYYADLALQIQAGLIDYSKLTAGVSYPISKVNAEVIFQGVFSYGIFTASKLTVVPELFNAYDPKDLRRSIFFTSNANGMTFKGNYSGDKNQFCGLATDEMYLIRAESAARSGHVSAALADLNYLLKNRWMGNYVPINISDPVLVLEYILKERRKELLFRGLRWQDLRRLNRDSRFAKTLSRVLDGNTYVLYPNDSRYVFPLDEEELRMTGIQQNIR